MLTPATALDNIFVSAKKEDDIMNEPQQSFPRCKHGAHQRLVSSTNKKNPAKYSVTTSKIVSLQNFNVDNNKIYLG